MTDTEKLFDKQLPPEEKFYLSLTEKGVSKEDYKHAQDFCKLYEIKNLGEYALRYFECDVIQLAQVFLHFHDNIFKWSKLKICHYFGTPGLAYDIFLKKSGVSIEMMTDKGMVSMVQSGIRGGLSFVNRRHVTAGCSRKKGCKNHKL